MALLFRSPAPRWLAAVAMVACLRAPKLAVGQELGLGRRYREVDAGDRQGAARSRRNSEDDLEYAGDDERTATRSTVANGSSPSFMRVYGRTQYGLELMAQYVPERRHDSPAIGTFDYRYGRISGVGKALSSTNARLELGGTYAIRELDFATADPLGDIPDARLLLHQLEFHPRLLFFVADSAMLDIRLRGGVFSSFDGGVRASDLQLLGRAQLAFAVRPRLQIVGGLAASNDFVDQLVFPLLGFRYLTPSEAWWWTVTLPLEAALHYSFSPRLQAFGGWFIEGNKFHYRRGGDGLDIYLRDTRLGAGAQFNPTQKILLTAEGGVLLGREALTLSSGGVEGEGDVNDRPYVRGSITLSF